MDDGQKDLEPHDDDSSSRDCSAIVAPLVGVLNGVGQEKVVHTPLGEVRPDRVQVGDAELGMERIVGDWPARGLGGCRGRSSPPPARDRPKSQRARPFRSLAGTDRPGDDDNFGGHDRLSHAGPPVDFNVPTR